jgi:large repetitive protein
MTTHSSAGRSTRRLGARLGRATLRLIPRAACASFCGLLVVFAVVGCAASMSPRSRFTPTGSMATGRDHHTATLLSDGRVLIAGGDEEGQALASAEVYDPKTGMFSATGSMATARENHTATLLSDGRVLIAGGGGRSTAATVESSAELYDPRTGGFSPTGPLTTGRRSHTATLLSDGRVLIVGGEGPVGGYLRSLASAELYDPKTGQFSPTGSMAEQRSQHTATLLADGRVLIVGKRRAEVYDPKTGAFSPAGSTAADRAGHTATLLSDGRVLIAGGWGADMGSAALATAEVYDPATGTFNPDSNLMTTGRYAHTATLLTDGHVLLAGGYAPSSTSSDHPQDQATAAAELYDPKDGTFSPTTGSMTAPRVSHTATLLADGSVLIAGGWGGNASSDAAQLYQP